MPKITPIVYVAAAATIVALAGLVTFMVVTDHDTTAFLVALAAIVPSVGSLFGINALARNQETILHNTNGRLSEAHARADRNAAMLRSALATMKPEDAAKIIGDAVNTSTGETPVVATTDAPTNPAS